MQSAARIAVSAFIITTVVASAYQNTAKLRRDGVLNLYPFPRVGRSSNSWQVPLEHFYLEYKPEHQKRQLYAFPRVGRSDVPLTLQQLQQLAPELLHLQSRLRPNDAAPMRNLLDLVMGGARNRGLSKRESESTDSTGMWFGPRLGRAFMGNDDDDVSIRSQSSEQSEPELAQPEVIEEREKRQAH